MYVNSGKLHYMDIKVSDDIREKIEEMQHKPIQDNTLNVKVPYRYNRVDCKVIGLTPVQDLKEGDEIFNSIQYCGKWGGGTFWKFDLIQKIDPPREV
jgi:hypothetical protein